MTSKVVYPQSGRTKQARKKLQPLDVVFRALVIVGSVEIVALIFNLYAYPTATGVAGQTPAFRAFLGLVWGPVMLFTGALLLWRAPGNIVSRFTILQGVIAIGGQFTFDLGDRNGIDDERAEVNSIVPVKIKRRRVFRAAVGIGEPPRY